MKIEKSYKLHEGTIVDISIDLNKLTMEKLESDKKIAVYKKFLDNVECCEWFLKNNTNYNELQIDIFKSLTLIEKIEALDKIDSFKLSEEDVLRFVIDGLILKIM